MRTFSCPAPYWRQGDGLLSRRASNWEKNHEKQTPNRFGVRGTFGRQQNSGRADRRRPARIGVPDARYSRVPGVPGQSLRVLQDGPGGRGCPSGARLCVYSCPRRTAPQSRATSPVISANITMSEKGGPCVRLFVTNPLAARLSSAQLFCSFVKSWLVQPRTSASVEGRRKSKPSAFAAIAFALSCAASLEASTVI